jgi:hypothetical protein
VLPISVGPAIYYRYQSVLGEIPGTASAEFYNRIEIPATIWVQFCADIAYIMAPLGFAWFRLLKHRNLRICWSRADFDSIVGTLRIVQSLVLQQPTDSLTC